MFSLESILASAMLVTCLNGLETSCAQGNHDEHMFNKLVDMECRLKQVEAVLYKFFSVDISWKQESTVDASTTSQTTASQTTTSPTRASPTTASQTTTSPTRASPTTASPTTTSPTTASPNCLNNWKPFQQSCYLFIEKLVNFNSAVEQCKSLGAHLVYVDSSEENIFLKDYIMSDGKDSFWWIGLTDNEKEGTWKLVGTDRVANFTDWHANKPDNWGRENCAAYTYWARFHWNDARCGDQYNFICEKEKL